MSSQQLHINQSLNAANYYYHRELANWTLTNCTHCWAIFHFYTNHTNSHSIQSSVELCVSRPEQTHRKKRKTYTDIYQWSNSSTSACPWHLCPSCETSADWLCGISWRWSHQMPKQNWWRQIKLSKARGRRGLGTGGNSGGGEGATYLQEHITIQQAVLEGAQLARPVAIVCVYVRQHSVLLLILMHNNCSRLRERNRKSEREIVRESVYSEWSLSIYERLFIFYWSLIFYTTSINNAAPKCFSLRPSRDNLKP